MAIATRDGGGSLTWHLSMTELVMATIAQALGVREVAMAS